MAVREVDGVFVISSRQQWLPGNYDSETTARWAFQFPTAVLERLEREVNQGQQRAITGADLSAAPATEAAERIRALEDLLGSIYLDIKWRWVTRQLTTEQKNLFADAVDASARRNGEPLRADRWWSDWPLCKVCQAPVERGDNGEWLDLRGNPDQPIAINWATVGMTPPHGHEVEDTEQRGGRS